LRALSALLLVLCSVGEASAQTSFVAFESDPVRPLALSDDGRQLYVANTPDGQLEIFDVGAFGLSHVQSVAVGMEPVAVAVRGRQVWVVNHLSDSVSIVDVGPPKAALVRTLQVGDEPRDVVFAGPGRSRAFVTAAHRGQNAPWFRGEYDRPGIGRADVWVFDANGPGQGPLEILTLFGDKPRALAVSPDGARVYAAVFRSGNRTATVPFSIVCSGGAAAGPCTVQGVSYPGGLPAPNENAAGVTGPTTGLVVRQEDAGGGGWRDELGRDWSAAIRFELPDLDVFAIDANADPPAQVDAWPGVGTVLFNMAVNPHSGVLYVSNSEAHNEVRFEGLGLYAARFKPPGEPASVRGHLHEARITVIEPGASQPVRPRHLNKHIPYGVSPVPPGVKERSLATPLEMAVSSDGRTLYVAAFGSAKIGVFDTQQLESGSFVPDAASQIELSGGGPAGLALDEDRGRLYVLTRFDDSVAVVDLATRRESSRIALHDPEPRSLVNGRPFLYDARLTSSNGEASCASCHIFGDVDDLAWDLGNPDGDTMLNTNPFVGFGPVFELHPIKGPMTTQTLRGLDHHGPQHWRGDRLGDAGQAFLAFNVAFHGLLGRDEGPLSDEQMQQFADFALQIKAPPNPIRRLDNQLRADEEQARQLFFDPSHNCVRCHDIDPTAGHFGTGGGSANTFLPQDFKVPQLRSAYQKVGMFGYPDDRFFALGSGSTAPQGPQVRGFGFLHEGGVDTVARFLEFFPFANDTERRAMEAFIMAFEGDLAPIVGQQVTIDGEEDTASLARLDLLRARASTPRPTLDLGLDANECDLVASASPPGSELGAVRLPSGDFLTGAGATVPESALRSIADRGTPVTFTCVPPGSGHRIGVDRDEDGVLNQLDNCPALLNPGQADLDLDRVGDLCDRCPSDADASQRDTDADGTGDACDPQCPDMPPTTVTRVEPSSDLSAGTPVTITGTGFSQVALIWFDNRPTLGIRQSPGVLSAFAPPGVEGSPAVVVVNPEGCRSPAAQGSPPACGLLGVEALLPLALASARRARRRACRPRR
jgi:sugar lactone lactonase YvrE